MRILRRVVIWDSSPTQEKKKEKGGLQILIFFFVFVYKLPVCVWRGVDMPISRNEQN